MSDKRKDNIAVGSVVFDAVGGPTVAKLQHLNKAGSSWLVVPPSGGFAAETA